MTQLHFLHPLWLLSLLPLAGLLWLLYRQKSGNSAWSKVIDANLLPLLLKGSETKTSRISILLLTFVWFISVLALADPVWKKIPRPVFQTNAARVIVLDLSRSMLIPDLKPSRLARARFKIEDILGRNEEGQIGLVVFAGDGFTAAPLTRDTDTIRSLLQVLKPNIMPAQGSRADLGLLKAFDLLKQAGVSNGQVLLIADGVVGGKAEDAAEILKRAGHTVSVLAVGTEEGGLIPQLNQAITVKLESQALQAVAKQGGGAYHLISNSNADLEQLLNPLVSNNAQKNAHQEPEENTESDLQSKDWESNAPYLILLLLPLAAFAFRRGWLLNIVLLTGVLMLSFQPQSAMAFSFSESWDDLWQRRDQQADKALHKENFQEASKLAKDFSRRGSAEYKQGNYQKALENFSQASGTDADYNRGNTLAKLEKYEDAIKAYEETLKQNKNHEDAKTNKSTVEKLLKEKQHKDPDKQNQKNKNADKQEGDENNKDQQQKEGEDSKQQEQSADKKQDKNSNKNSDKNDQQKQAESKQQDSQQQDQKNQFSDAAKKLEQNKKTDYQAQQENKSGGEEDKNKDETAQQNKAEEEQNEDSDHSNKKAMDGTNAQAQELTKEEKLAAEQWLRRIPDDPGGLLRRKFTRQYRQRHPQQRGPANNTNFW